MLFLVISTPRAESPSNARGGQKAWWDWLNALMEKGTVKHAWTKLGRGAVLVFDVDSHETLHKLINQWAENVPATFEVTAMIPKEVQERIARAGTNPLSL